MDNLCPVCGNKAIMRCRCLMADSKCANNHRWHKCTIHNKIVIGPSDHSKDTMRCTCNAIGYTNAP